MPFFEYIKVYMVEVFKTNVSLKSQAKVIIEQIHKRFAHTATFDLQDHDRVLRVISSSATVDTHQLIQLLNDLGFEAEVMPDTIPISIKLIDASQTCTV